MPTNDSTGAPAKPAVARSLATSPIGNMLRRGAVPTRAAGPQNLPGPTAPPPVPAATSGTSPQAAHPGGSPSQGAQPKGRVVTPLGSASASAFAAPPRVAPSAAKPAVNAHQGAGAPAPSEGVGSAQTPATTKAASSPDTARVPSVAAAPAPAEAKASAGASLLTKARSHINAVKTVTSLAMAVEAVIPKGEKAQKASELCKLLVFAHDVGREMAAAARPFSDPRGWAQAVCTEVVADAIAKRAAKEGTLDTAPIVSALQTAADCFDLAGGEPTLSGVLDSIQSKSYVEATDDRAIRDRIAVSLASSTWDLHGVVASVVDHKGEPFSFGWETTAVVTHLTQGVVAVAAESAREMVDKESRVMATQSAIRRLFGLIGSRYQLFARFLLDDLKASNEAISLEDMRRAAMETLTEIRLDSIELFRQINAIAPQAYADSEQEVARALELARAGDSRRASADRQSPQSAARSRPTQSGA